MPQEQTIMDNPNPSHEKRSGATIKYPPTPPEIQQMDIFPASSPHFNDLAREIVTAPQIPRVTQPGSQTFANPNPETFRSVPPSEPQFSAREQTHSTPTQKPTHHESQQHPVRLEIHRSLKIGDCCFAKYFEDGLYYSARVVDIHPSANTAVVKYDDYNVPEEVMAEDILPESPPSRRLNPHSSSRE